MAGLVSIFRESEILIAGANGFLGKVLLALLLDRFPGVRRVHVLVRPRPDRSASERFEQEVLDSPPFRPLIKRFGRAQVAQRVRVHAGDAALPQAGFSTERVQELSNSVDLVLNCAGLVEFFPAVDRSIRANVDSVEQLLDLCARIDAKLLHVSTCYVAGEGDGLVEETEPIEGFVPTRGSNGHDSFRARDELEACRAAITEATHGLEGPSRDDTLTELGRGRASRLGWVNTYTYTKSLGEQLLVEQSEVPCAIVRPAIVESALRYPFQGWIEGGRTAAPLVLMALGGLRDWPARPDLALEIVPVDLVAAATLVVAAELLDSRAKTVYHLSAADVNPYPLGDLIRLLCEQARSTSDIHWTFSLLLDPWPRVRFHDHGRAARRTRVRLERVRRMRRLMESAGQTLLASRLRILELQIAFHEDTFRQYLPFILENRYIFEAGNIRSSYASLSAEDRTTLPWDPERIDWPSYWLDCQIPGIRKWVQPDAVRDWGFQL